MKKIFFFVSCFIHDIVQATYITATSLYQSPCPNHCSGNGKCTLPYGVCTCFRGFTGSDCSLRICPSGKAWTDDMSHTTITKNNQGHVLTECSNRGCCDRVLGECSCEHGLYEGSACERKTCPSSYSTSFPFHGTCSNHGMCISMSMLAQKADPGNPIIRQSCLQNDICLNANCTIRDYYSTCQSVPLYDTPWDSHTLFGCFCDSEYHGYDCSQRSCPTGDDPLTTLQVNEVQKLICTATGGTFTLSFMGYATPSISVMATVNEFTTALTSLHSITKTWNRPSILVQYSNVDNVACNATGNTILVTFLQNFGDISLLLPDGSQLVHSQNGSVPLFTSEKYIHGNKENAICTNHGLCDTSTGMCTCFDSWKSSDGYGGAGTRGDCGYWSNPNSTVTSCPGVPTCHNHGICSGSPTFQCLCEDGRGGPDCSLVTCPYGKSWFQFPSSNNSAHTLSECSEMGLCDQESGSCSCAEGFTGSACEYTTCPGIDGDATCNQHGICLTMSSMVANNKNNGEPLPYLYGPILNNPLTWDHDKMRGCLCSEGWGGYDCSLRTCPRGDDPQTVHQYNEIQSLSCSDIDSNGTITLTFRGIETEPLHANDTLSTLENALNNISTINSVKVTLFNSSASTNERYSLPICPVSNQTIHIEFLSPTGDVPVIKFSSSQLDEVELVEFVKGTKEYIECSNRGICDYSRGLCYCFVGYGSSDGQGKAGIMGDCGYRLPFPVG